jgi:hypothetical protein
MPVKADYARAQWAYSELLSPTQRDKSTSRDASGRLNASRPGQAGI